MPTTLAFPKIISLPVILRSEEPKKAISDGLVELLTDRLAELDIIWNAEAFTLGLNSPDLSPELLSRLETILSLAESLNWNISPSLRNELDETVEDIEASNPEFIKSLREEVAAAQADVAAGRVYTLEEVSKELGIR